MDRRSNLRRDACHRIGAATLVAALLFCASLFTAATPAALHGSQAPASKAHPDELTFVAPAATARLSEVERCFSMGGSVMEAKVRCPPRKPVDNAELMRGEKRASYPSEFPGLTSPRVILDNPYLPADRGFFNKIRSMACDPKGGLWVTATAWLKPNLNPYASGIWRVAPDGQITALAAKPWALETSRLYPACNAPFQKSAMTVDELMRLTPASDGSMLAVSGDGRTISRIQTDLTIQYLAGGGACARGARGEGYVDGRVDDAKFNGIAAVLEDPQNNIWVGDGGNCALRRIAGGRVTTVVPPERACPKNDPEHHLVFDYFAWDPKSGELIVAGTNLTGSPLNFYSSVWRVSPDGAMKRLYLAKGLGSGPNTGLSPIGGLALDGAGAIWIAQSFYGMDDGSRIVRVEAGGRAVRVAGAPVPVNVDHADGPAQEALFDDMTSMCFDSQDTLFVHARNMIRKMTRDGRVTSWAY